MCEATRQHDTALGVQPSADLVLPITGASSPHSPTEAQRLRDGAAHSHCNPSFHSPYVQYNLL